MQWLRDEREQRGLRAQKEVPLEMVRKSAMGEITGGLVIIFKESGLLL